MTLYESYEYGDAARHYGPHHKRAHRNPYGRAPALHPQRTSPLRHR
jgi:hypothetical protein